jgi:hypothetical protein
MLTVGAMVALSASGAAPPDTWDLPSHPYRVPLAAAGPVAAAPPEGRVLVVVLRAGDGIDSDNGGQLAFVAGGSEPLPYEVEAWDRDGSSVVWVAVDASGPVDLVESPLLLYFGAQPAVDPPPAEPTLGVEGPHPVWGDASVWHLSDPGCEIERCGVGPGTLRASGALAAEGRMGGGAQLDGAGRLRYEVEPPLQALSASMWFRRRRGGSSPATDQVLMAGPLDPLGVRRCGRRGLGLWRGGDLGCERPIPRGTDGWHHLVLVEDGLAATVHLDGAPVIRLPSGTLSGIGGMVFGGPDDPAGFGLHARVDEIRIAPRVWSEERILSDWLAMRRPLMVSGPVERQQLLPPVEPPGGPSRLASGSCAIPAGPGGWPLLAALIALVVVRRP